MSGFRLESGVTHPAVATTVDSGPAAVPGRLPRIWRVAVIAASLAMLGWLIWHAAGAIVATERMQASHVEAAQRHDRLLRLETELRRTAQLGIGADDGASHLEHQAIERELRETITSLLAGQPRADQREHLDQALVSIDNLSRIEAQALVAASPQAAMALITGPDYQQQLAALTAALKRFDASYHDWALRQAIGLNTRELSSLGVALVLFATVIGAWLVLLRRLQGERTALIGEMARRRTAEHEMLQAQKDHVLGELAGSIAHDMNNVLSAAAGYAELAGRAETDAARHQAVAGLAKAVDQGRGLTRNLLAFTRQEPSRREPLELGRFVRETQAWMAPLMPANIRIRISADSLSELWVEADLVQLQQAFVNLALNARDAMPQGGSLEIALCKRQPTTAHSSRAPDLACLRLTDSGTGMDARTLARARDPLFTTKPRGHGVGLGLPAVVRVVESHGGQLQIESAPGQGTSVRILLPTCAQPQQRRIRQTPRRALIVSTDPYRRELLRSALEEHGIEVSEATEVDLPKPASAEMKPDVIILEHQGSDAEALGLVRHIDAGRRRTPVILIAGITDARIESQLAARVHLVSGPAALGELAALAARLASPSDARRSA